MEAWGLGGREAGRQGSREAGKQGKESDHLLRRSPRI